MKFDAEKKSLNELRDQLKAVPNPSGHVRDAASRIAGVIGSLEQIENEADTADTAIADLQKQVNTAAAAK